MASRKRKQKPPERFSEEKRTKMTWNMLDMAPCLSDESVTASEESVDETTSTGRGLNYAKRNKQKAVDRRKLELNLENNYSQYYVCQLGAFNVSLCTNKEQEDEVRKINGKSNGLNLSSASITHEEWSNLNHPCVNVRLSFESQCLSSSSSSTTTTTEDMNLGDSLKQVSFKAVVPSVSKENLEALAYLQNKGVISLVLKPEQHILKDSWEVVVCLYESGLTKLSFASVDPTNRKIDKMMKVLMAWFYNVPVENELVTHDCDAPSIDKSFDELYDAVKDTRKRACCVDSPVQEVSEMPQTSSVCPHLSHKCDIHSERCIYCSHCNNKLNQPNGVTITDVQHPKLKPVLRGYQRKAVDWMLNKEQSYQLCCHGNQLNGMIN